MKKCLKITFGAEIPENFLQSSIQKHARKFSVEGTAQIFLADKQVRVIVWVSAVSGVGLGFTNPVVCL